VGMRREGELRNESVGMDGTLRTMVVFGMTDGEWKAGVARVI
jgi:hypothetical protein